MRRFFCTLLAFVLILTFAPVPAMGSGSVLITVPAEYSIDGKTSYDLSDSEYNALLEKVHDSIQAELDEMCQGFFHYESIKVNEDCTVYTVTVNDVTQSEAELAAEGTMFALREKYAAYASEKAEGVRIDYKNMVGGLLWSSDVGDLPLLILEENTPQTSSHSTSNPTSSSGTTSTPTPTQTPAKSEPTYSYVLNTNTKKFHYPDCKSVKQMKEKNKYFYDGTRSEVIGMGYEPCGNCHP